MSLKKIKQLIRQHERFLISTHVNPDADAISSILALGIALKKMGKKVHVVIEEPLSVRFHFFPKSQLVQSIEGIKSLAYDVAFVLDCGELSRIGQVQRLLDLNKTIVNIDHHVTNNLFGHVQLVDSQASSAAEVLFGLLRSMRFALTKEVAMLLYIGILTDTGSFRYENCSAHTHRVVSELLQFNIKVNQIYNQLYERVPLKDLNQLSKILSRFESFFEGKVLCVSIVKKTLDLYSPEFDVKEKIFAFLRMIENVEVVMILSEHKPMVTRVNFRAQGEAINVAQLAQEFQGGGHRKASGCTISTNLKNAQKQILAKMKSIL